MPLLVQYSPVHGLRSALAPPLSSRGRLSLHGGGAPPAPTVTDRAERYQREHAEMHCKPATVPHYRLMLRKHLVPALGEHLVADVEP